MALLTAEQILACDDRPFEVVAVPEWGGEVRVQVMSGKQRAEWDAVAYSLKGGKVDVNRDAFRSLLVLHTAAGEDGAPLFTREQLAQLESRNSIALDRVAAVALRLNKLGGEALKEAEGNSAPGPSGDGTSS